MAASLQPGNLAATVHLQSLRDEPRFVPRAGSSQSRDLCSYSVNRQLPDFCSIPIHTEFGCIFFSPRSPFICSQRTAFDDHASSRCRRNVLFTGQWDAVNSQGVRRIRHRSISVSADAPIFAYSNKLFLFKILYSRNYSRTPLNGNDDSLSTCLSCASLGLLTITRKDRKRCISRKEVS